jgi:hypothetical protein
MDQAPFNLQQLMIGGGQVSADADAPGHLRIPPMASGYANAQLDDYHKLSRRRFPWQPPAGFIVRARASLSHPKGTLGFGFWNDPFSLSFGQAGAARKLPVSPQAVWFFYGSPPNDMALAPPNPGWGWKAQVLEAPSIPGWLLAVPALAAYAAVKLPVLRRPLMHTMLRQVACEERMLETDLNAWHTYEIQWRSNGVSFLVDGILTLESSISPAGPLGFVTWIDNQFAIVSPAGGIRFGVIPTEVEQSFELQTLELRQLNA